MLIKKLLLVTISLTLAIVILVWGIVDISIKNGRNLQKIEGLKSELNKMEVKIKEKSSELQKLNFLEYRDKVVRKKYPVFSKIVDVVYKKSKEYGFNHNLILSLIQIESNFNPRAVSSKGAFGLMQVNYSVWKEELDIDNLRIFNIEYNIDLGLQILKKYYEEAQGDLLKTLHLYNNGYLHNNQKYKHKVVSSVFY